MNLQQKNKTANQYTKEVEHMTKALESAYINDGLSLDLANKYTTQHAIKAMTTNCSIEKVKRIMQAGTFNTMNDAISKFVGSCTDATGKSDAVLFCRQNRGNRNGNSNRGRNNNGNYNNYKNYNRNRNNNRGNRGGGNRGNNNSNRGRSYNNTNNNNNNVRITQGSSENQQAPLDTQN